MINNIEQNIQRIQRLGLSCALNDNGRERYFHHGHEYIEIGGLKWAIMNVGAQKVTDGGLYFQWGDIQGYTAEQVGIESDKKYFGWASYKYNNGTSDPSCADITKYNSADGKTILDLEDDAARANWGGNWRIPTSEEWQAFVAAVNAVWITDYQSSGINGLLCTAKNGNGAQLFFPAVGYCSNGSVNYVGSYGYYWSSSLSASDVLLARYLYFNSGGTFWNYYSTRRVGRSVRGVVG